MSSTEQTNTSQIPDEVRDLLTTDRYGITFPSNSGCKLQLIRGGKDLGRYYSYREWGGIRKAVQAAISRCRQLRALHPKQKTPRADASSPFEGLTWGSQTDKRSGTTEWRYQVTWREQGNTKTKTFSLGADFTPDQRFHAYRTAIQFLHEYKLYTILFEPEKYVHWRTLRMYVADTPTVPLDMWRSESGEARAFREMAPAYRQALEDEQRKIDQENKTAAIATVVESMKAQGISIEDLMTGLG